MDPAVSGWRDKDEDRIQELVELFRAPGNYNTGLLRGPRALYHSHEDRPMLDSSGHMLLDDGLSTVCALQTLQAEWEVAQAKTCEDDEVGT